MTTAIPTITLNNGVEMPQVGFGVFQVPNEETTAAVAAALKAGYRSIDTAAIYGNEEGVGKALAQSGIAREELFITSKIWIADMGYEQTLEAFEASLQRLGLDYLDLFLIHWPAPEKDLYVETWKALEKLYADKKIRAIGVSNFQPEHLDKLTAGGSIVPAVNQVELHPALQNREVIAANTGHGIVTEAWSPLAQGAMLTDETIEAIANVHEVTAAQVILRWHLQQGRVIIPKSVTESRIIANLDLFGFELTSDELANIDALDRDGRTGPNPDTFNG
ncbi:aldo/keto reductase [Glutamicibacter halophytocola]|uniref:Aldo/keto reductase n=1 Tax=Glutamicibacter halophytocola TaxID=1933880 RepID=A0A5B8IPN8_9MICC|nr:aldo/keto reductase [Glutamicibacter halophytocola]NQD39450.1 aldo/keto reductase [Glutamicibacter halophytocola]QDY67654.1 aldo/keto reductase [Glutamicibacter halophytocola]UUX59837.1 aldo/keto reductase [Glutamicibacter halophytocola]